MSLNTNSWDFIYTTYPQKQESPNVVLRTDVLFKGFNIKNNILDLKITKSKVTIGTSSNLSNILLTAVCSVDYSGAGISETNKNLTLKFTLNIDWVNKKGKKPTSSADLNVEISANPNSTIIKENDIVNYFLESHSADNTLDSGITRPTNPFYDYFLKLSFFTDWMDSAIVRIGRKQNEYTTENDKKDYIAFCYMLSKKDKDKELAFNNNPAFVDLNAIPAGATSALVIERSVFGEYMVKAAFGKKIDPAPPNPLPTFVGLLFDNSDTVLAKAGTYAFSNNVDIPLKSKDYKNGSGAPVGGTVPKERMLLSIEESNIKLAMGDVGYTFDSLNKPTINQEYVFDLKWQADSTDTTKSKIVASGKEKLFIISNDFKKDTASENLLNWLFPAIRYGLVEPIVKSVADRLFRDLNEKGFIRIEKKKLK